MSRRRPRRWCRPGEPAAQYNELSTIKHTVSPDEIEYRLARPRDMSVLPVTGELRPWRSVEERPLQPAGTAARAWRRSPTKTSPHLRRPLRYRRLQLPPACRLPRCDLRQRRMWGGTKAALRLRSYRRNTRPAAPAVTAVGCAWRKQISLERDAAHGVVGGPRCRWVEFRVDQHTDFAGEPVVTERIRRLGAASVRSFPATPVLFSRGRPSTGP